MGRSGGAGRRGDGVPTRAATSARASTVGGRRARRRWARGRARARRRRRGRARRPASRSRCGAGHDVRACDARLHAGSSRRRRFRPSAMPGRLGEAQLKPWLLRLQRNRRPPAAVVAALHAALEKRRALRACAACLRASHRGEAALAAAGDARGVARGAAAHLKALRRAADAVRAQPPPGAGAETRASAASTGSSAVTSFRRGATHERRRVLRVAVRRRAVRRGAGLSTTGRAKRRATPAARRVQLALAPAFKRRVRGAARRAPFRGDPACFGVPGRVPRVRARFRAATRLHAHAKVERRAARPPPPAKEARAPRRAGRAVTAAHAAALEGVAALRDGRGADRRTATARASAPLDGARAVRRADDCTDWLDEPRRPMGSRWSHAATRVPFGPHGRALGPSTTRIVGEICLDAAAVRPRAPPPAARAPRRGARASARQPPPSATPGRRPGRRCLHGRRRRLHEREGYGEGYGESDGDGEARGSGGVVVRDESIRQFGRRVGGRAVARRRFFGRRTEQRRETASRVSDDFYDVVSRDTRGVRVPRTRRRRRGRPRVRRVRGGGGSGRARTFSRDV